MSGTNTAGASPFTVSQWHELEHQALIFKYLTAGMRIPPDLLLPIRKSFESISSNFFHHPTMAYCSLYGKKVDPEPGRCKRTDGKKWRCSKDAYLDSKYCERHMHRGRSRSRKPVESQTASQTVSTVTKMTGGSGGGAGSSQTFPLHSFDNPPPGGPGLGSNSSHFNMESIPYGIPNKDYWYPHKYKTDVGEHSFFEASGSHQMDSPLDNNTWPLMPSRISSFPQSKSAGNNLVLQNDYPQSSFFGSEFGSGQPGKQECQSLRPFFDEWPRTRNSWSPHEEQSSQTSFSTTQLSMSIPMASPDLSTDSRSSHDD